MEYKDERRQSSVQEKKEICRVLLDGKSSSLRSADMVCECVCFSLKVCSMVLLLSVHFICLRFNYIFKKELIIIAFRNDLLARRPQQNRML